MTARLPHIGAILRAGWTATRRSAPQASSRIPGLRDGGVRRGGDAQKALAPGATAVGIGRPLCLGPGAFGQVGVERAPALLNAELRLAMVGVGARSLTDVTSHVLIRRA